MLRFGHHLFNVMNNETKPVTDQSDGKILKNSAPKYNSKFSPRTWCISLAVTRNMVLTELQLYDWYNMNDNAEKELFICWFVVSPWKPYHMHDQMTHRILTSTETCSIAYTTNVTDETNAMWTWKWSFLNSKKTFGLPFYLFRAINLHCCVFPARDSDTRLMCCLFTKNVMSSIREKQISW